MTTHSSMTDKKDWSFYRKWLERDFRQEHSYERLQAELDAWAAYISQKETRLQDIEKAGRHVVRVLSPGGVSKTEHASDLAALSALLDGDK